MKNKPNFFFDNRGFPNWGGWGGPPLGNFSHIIPFFSSDNVPKYKNFSLGLPKSIFGAGETKYSASVHKTEKY